MAYQNQVIIITGASSGIGAALALELSQRGAKLGLIARRSDKLHELRDTIRKSGGIVECAAADVSDREAIHTAIAQLRQSLGPIDRLIANAGVGTFTSFQPSNVPDQERLIRINLFGVIYSIEAVLPEMLERRQGHLIGVSSLAGYRGLPGQSAYCASKAGMIGYLDGLRISLRKTGVAVTTICPGFVTTPMTADNPPNMPFIMSAERAATRMANAIDRRAKIYNFPFRTWLLVWLSRWAPDWAVARVMSGYDEKAQERTRRSVEGEGKISPS